VNIARNARAHAGWLIPTGLIMLGLIPALAAIVRLVHLGTGAPVTPDNARFLGAPLPVVLHLAFSLVYGILGAFQFSPSVLRRNPAWHRAAGKALVLSGLIVALSGVWLTLIFPIVKAEGLGRFDGMGLYVIRILVGLAMAGAIVRGVVAIRKRDVLSHRAWMLRGYALGMGAGTQVFTHIPWFVFPGIQGEVARTLCMAAGWGLNLALAEWVIARSGRTGQALDAGRHIKQASEV